MAWAELHARHKATHELMAHLHKARRLQGVLLEKVAQQKAANKAAFLKSHR